MIKRKFTREISMIIHGNTDNDISLKKSYIVVRKEGMYLHEKDKILPDDLVGIYAEMADIIGIENTKKLYENFKGQQVSFPMRLYTKDYILKQVSSNNEESIKVQATKYGYTERRLRQLMKDYSVARVM